VSEQGLRNKKDFLIFTTRQGQAKPQKALPASNKSQKKRKIFTNRVLLLLLLLLLLLMICFLVEKSFLSYGNWHSKAESVFIFIIMAKSFHLKLPPFNNVQTNK